MAKGREHVVASTILVLVLAFAVKTGYLSERLQLPDLHHPTMDAKFHDEWAAGLAFGTWTANLERIRNEPYFRAPLYPYAVSGVYRVAGRNPTAVFFLQALLGAVNVALMFVVCRRLFGTRAGWIGSIVMIGYWPVTYFDAEMLIPVLAVALDLAFLLSLIIAMESTRVRFTLIAGLVLGLAAITRPNILLAAPVAGWFLTARAPVHRGRRLAAFVLGAVLAILPVTVRNGIVGHDFVPIASQGGGNFYIGNNPKSDGVTAVIPGTRADWWGGFEDWRAVATRAEGRALKPSEVSGYWYRRGVAFLIHDPRTAARLYVRKFRLLFGNGEVSNQRQMYFVREQSRVLSTLPVNFAFILAMSALGLVALVRTGRRAAWKEPRLLPHMLAIVYGLSVLIFFVSSRHRLPMAILLIPGAAVGCSAIIDAASRRVWRTLGGELVLALAIFTASMANPLHVGALAEARGQFDLGIDYMHDNDLGRASTWLDAAIASDPSYAPAWLARGRVNAWSDRLESALLDFERAAVLDSTLADVFLQTGVVLQKLGRHDEAGRAYRRALTLDPSSVEALNNLADVSFRQDQPETAKGYLARALALDPAFPNSLYGLGYYYELKGDRDRAIEFYRRAGDYEPARQRLQGLLESPIGGK